MKPLQFLLSDQEKEALCSKHGVIYGLREIIDMYETTLIEEGFHHNTGFWKPTFKDWLTNMIVLTYNRRLTQKNAEELVNRLDTQDKVFMYGSRVNGVPLTIEYAESLNKLFVALGANVAYPFWEYGARRSLLAKMVDPGMELLIPTDIDPQDDDVIKMDWLDAIKDHKFVFASWPTVPSQGSMNTATDWIRQGLNAGRTLVLVGEYVDDYVNRSQETLKGHVTLATDIVSDFIDPLSWKPECGFGTTRTIVVR